MIKVNDILKDFFSFSFEKKINEKMLEFSYKYERELVLSYILSLNKIKLDDFVKYIVENYNITYLESNDVVQFSDFDVCTTKICSVIKGAGDKGFEILEIGKLLQNDGSSRLDGAYRKYGENHAKTATHLGLLYKLSNKYFLSCIGYIFNELNKNEQEKLITRLILRNKLIQRLLYKSIKNNKASYDYEVSGFLKETTVNRRRSNVKKLLEILKNNKEADLNKIIINIVI